MKLRNKKTGEIVDLSIFGISLNIRKEQQPTYHSIKQLCEDWEDVKEPLIKDPKIRKAVRAWAEANDTRESGGIGKVFFDGDEWEFKFSEFGIARIQFNRPLVPDMEDKEYTITELCGEEL